MRPHPKTMLGPSPCLLYAAGVSTAKLVLQRTVEVLYCMVAESRVPPRRYTYHLE